MPGQSQQHQARCLGTLICLSMAVFAAPAMAQDTEPVSVRDALERASKHHPDLVQARLRAKRAEVLAEGDESLLTPVLSFNGSYLHNEEPTQGLFEEGVRVTDVFATQTQLLKRFGWGTDVTLQFDANRFESEQPFVLPGNIRQIQKIGPNWQETLSLSLRQPILKGFGREVNEAPIRATAAQLDAATLEVQRTASQGALEVLSAWHELAFAERSAAIRERQMAIVKEQREATDALVTAGTLAEIELDVIDQRILLLEESALVAESTLRTRRAELARLIGAPRRTGVRPDGPLEAPTPSVDADTLVEEALARNMEIRLLKEQLSAQRLTLEVNEDNVLPQLDLTLRLSQNALSEEGFFDAAGQIAKLEASALFMGLLFTMPLDNSRAKAQVQADRLEMQRQEVQIGALERQIADQVRELAQQLDDLTRRVAITARAVELARTPLEAEQAKFRAGMSTNQQVLQFQDALQQAEERALRAEIDLIQAAVQVRHLTGSLLDAYGLEVTP